jgi:hypothetical protein
MDALVAQLREVGIGFEEGLRPKEVSEIEARYNFSFPPDLREFLATGLPISPNFPNWRTGQMEIPRGLIPIEENLNWPMTGICFDIEKNDFWMPDWGPRPKDADKALQRAREIINEAPKLIPVYGHRFLPTEPMLAGNPVLSVWQADIIYYGTDLVSYLGREFGLNSSKRENGSKSPRRIRFWSDIIDKLDSDFEAERSDG